MHLLNTPDNYYYFTNLIPNTTYSFSYETMIKNETLSFGYVYATTDPLPTLKYLFHSFSFPFPFPLSLSQLFFFD